MENEIKKYLEQYDFINFALFFGSYVNGKAGNMSDLDIGIYCEENPDLLLLGKIIYDLEIITKKKIDLLELKDIYKKNPALAYRIATKHKIIFVRDNELFIEFKRRAFLYYFDTEKLRKSVRDTFYERISSKKFGKRNYA